MPRETGSTEPQPSRGTTTSGLTRRTPTLASALIRGWRRQIGHRLDEARYHVGIDLGTTNSSVAIVDALALLDGDTDAAVSVLPVRQECSDGTITSPLLASVVAEVLPGEWWVGRGAREARSRGLMRGRQIFYSTKSEMGLGREPFYPFAGSGQYDSPWKVAGRVLAELARAVECEVGPEPLERAVVTVPASFQLAARKDTFRAAGLAGLPLSEEALLDEPNAALLDYLLTCRPRTEDGGFFDLSHPRTVLVFDFGGGTCDVSVVRVHADRDEQQLRLANLSIARYERLGGDNIDAAIVERVLLPQLLKQNGLATLDLSFSEKQERIVPQLLSVAEALKLGLRGVPREPPGGAAGAGGGSAPGAHAAPPVDDGGPARRGAEAFPGHRLRVPPGHGDEPGLLHLRPGEGCPAAGPARRRAGGRDPPGGGQRPPAAGAGGSRGVLPAGRDPAVPGRRADALRGGAGGGPALLLPPRASGGRCCGPSRRRAWGSSRRRAGTSSSSRGAPSCRSPRTGRRRGRAAWWCRAT